MTITKIHARSVYDSRGNPTVEVDLVDSTGLHRAIVPSVRLLQLALSFSAKLTLKDLRVPRQASTRPANCAMGISQNGMAKA